MGKTPRNYSKGASRGFVNYAGKHGIVHSKTYQDSRYGQKQKFVLGQGNDNTRSKSSRLLKITSK